MRAHPCNGERAKLTKLRKNTRYVDAAIHITRRSATARTFFDQTDRDRQILLNRRSSGLIERHEAARRAMLDLAKKHRANLRIVGARDLAPDLSISVAKPAIRAEVPCIQEGKNRPVKYGCLRRIGRTLRGFGAVEADFCAPGPLFT
jgi:hypothetical protein